ncbi:hypothetical protein BGZ49_003391 [Haplosporangium sp. Z 27]|nr:hypothetical protein BGZ49_003391 [Haplosporangium sp. Z 27]
MDNTIPFSIEEMQMTGQQFQCFRHGNTIEKVCVRITQVSTNNNGTSSYYVILDDVRDVFPQAIRFKLNENPIPFLLGPDGRRIEPLRIAFYPDDVLEVITALSQSTTTVHSPTIRNLDIQPSQRHLLSSSNLPQSFSSFQGVDEFEQAEVTKSGLAQNLSDIEKHLVENKEASQEMKEMRRQIMNLMQEIKERNDRVIMPQLEAEGNDSQMKALQLEVKEKDDKAALIQNQVLELQNQIFDLQNQALDRLAILQKHAHTIFSQNFELHEHPIPRLFIILPVDKTKWDTIRVLENKLRLHFLCECGYHTMEASKSDENRIYIAKHNGYEIKNDTEFYKKYGKYMHILMRTLRLGMKPADISIPHIRLPTLLYAGISFSIEYMEALSKGDPLLENINTIDDYEGLEWADLQQLGTFLQTNDQNKELGSLYRTATKTGHVKWICNEHYRLTYKEEEQKVFAMIVAMNGGKYDWGLGRVSIVLGSRIRAQEFFTALAKARHVYDLDIKFDWECTMSDIGAFEEALKVSSVSILRLDLQQLRPSVSSTQSSTPTQYNMLVHIMEHANMKTIHIALSMESINLFNIQPKRSHLRSLSVAVTPRSMDSSAFQILVTTIKANTPLTALSLSDNWIEDEDAVALSDALKTNTTLTNLDLSGNLMEEEGATALSDALKINSTLTTLNLSVNSIGNEGAIALSSTLKANATLMALNLTNNLIGKEGANALSEALKANTTLTILNLTSNSIKKEGAIALSYALALKTNTALTTLNLANNSIREEGAIALSAALITNTTLTTLDLKNNSIGKEGAFALSEALKTNTTLTTLDLIDNLIKNEGALALSEALKTNTTLTTLNLGGNLIEKEGSIALSEALKTNVTLTTLDLRFNWIRKEGALALSDALKINATLITLDLYGNSVGNEGAIALSDALETNATLTTLDLSGNSIGKEGALALFEALKTNTTLTTLDLSDNSIGKEGALALSEVLKTKTTLTILQ